MDYLFSRSKQIRWYYVLKISFHSRIASIIFPALSPMRGPIYSNNERKYLRLCYTSRSTTWRNFSVGRYKIICRRNHGFSVAQITVVPIEMPRGIERYPCIFEWYFEGDSLRRKIYGRYERYVINCNAIRANGDGR